MGLKQDIQEVQAKYAIFKYISLFGLFGIALGIIGGYLYYYFIGCQSGSCPITSNPWASIGWGAVFGYLIGDSIMPRKKKKDDISEDENISEKKEEQ